MVVNKKLKTNYILNGMIVDYKKKPNQKILDEIVGTKIGQKMDKKWTENGPKTQKVEEKWTKKRRKKDEKRTKKRR